MVLDLLDELRCPFHKREGVLHLESYDHKVALDICDLRSLLCTKCGRRFPVVDGILDFVVANSDQSYQDFSVTEARQWDAHASNYDTTRSRDAIYLATCEATAQSLLPLERDQLILDVGCGTGMVTELYASQSTRLMCVDLSLESLRVCRTRLSANKNDALFIRADATNLPFRSKCVSRVLCANMMQHLPTAAIRQNLVHELARVASPEARVVISTHCYSVSKRNQGWKQEGSATSASGSVQYIYRSEPHEFRR